MSYASIAARDAPPTSEQPHSDPALLTTERFSSSNIIDDASKVNVISRDEDLRTTSTSNVYIQEDIDDEPIGTKRTEVKSKGNNKRLHEARVEGSSYLWDVTKHYLLRPGVAGGLLGLVNISFLSSVGYAFYAKHSLRRNITAIGSTMVATLFLIGTEGWAAAKYREIYRGRQEKRPTCGEGMPLFRHLCEQNFRPSVLRGSVGLVNTAILGAVCYYSYMNWNKPKWNKDIVTAVSFGLLMLWGSEGYFAEHYCIKRDDRKQY